MRTMKNIMSVDLEDYFCDLPHEEWGKYESRIEITTNTILDLFEKYRVNATFFVLGFIAEQFPELIEKIKSKGHELASHGYYHKDIRKLSKEDFESELVNSLKMIRKVSGEKVLGFRAPFFSITEKNFWVFDILRKYLTYDSSIFPVRTPLYGIPKAPRYQYLMSEENPIQEDPNGTFIEFPLATLKIPCYGNLPIAGGFYLRFFPNAILNIGIKKINNNGYSAMCYIHPKDLDPKMPRLKEYSWHFYWGLNNSLKKYESLLKNFKFTSVREILNK